MAIKKRNVAVDDEEIPRGMKAFTVVRATIKDSTGSYRAMGERAYLTEKLAKVYHQRKQIQVDLPSYADDTSVENVEKQTRKPN